MDTHFTFIDPPKYNSINTRAKGFSLMNQGIYTIVFLHKILVSIFNVTDINSDITNKRMYTFYTLYTIVYIVYIWVYSWVSATFYFLMTMQL